MFASKQSEDPLVRFQVEIRKSYMDELKALQEAGGASSGKELLNNAIALLNWAVAQKQRGSSICAVDVNGVVTKELVLPFLEEAAKKQPLRLVVDNNSSEDVESELDKIHHRKNRRKASAFAG